MGRLAWPWWTLRPASRAATLRRLRAGLRAAHRRCQPEAPVVKELLSARRALITAQGELASCARCARHCEPPHGRWAGGFCCGGEAEAIFVPAELATLAAAGAEPADLRPPAGLHELAGCVFRGPRGCSLGADHRPSICLAHLCDDVGRELAEAGRGRELGALADRLTAAQRAFAVALSAD